MNIHTSVEYIESLDHQIQLRNVYIDILRREHVMQTGAPPPINFAAHVNDAEIKREKKIYEKVQESMVNEEVFGTVFMDFTVVEADNDHGYNAMLTMIDEASDFILIEPKRRD